MYKIRKLVSFALLLCVFVGCISGSATSAEIPGVAVNIGGSSQIQSDRSAIQYFRSMQENDFYGGMYYDEDTLVINLVDNGNLDYMLHNNDTLSSYMDSNSNNIEYRYVAYSLSYLESVKDYLQSYMAEFSILVLDAHETTNKVDVSLKNFDENTMSAICDVVTERFGSSDCLNFIDFSNITIGSTVAYEKPDYKNKMNQHIEAEQNSIVLVVPRLIKMNEGYYTLGPALSSSTAVSAGHGVANHGTVNVYDAEQEDEPIIGTAVGQYGGSKGDKSQITISSDYTLFPVISEIMPRYDVEGDHVMMMGAVSGKTDGEILATNQTVAALPPYANLTGMCSASYSCALGDSGAGIYPYLDSGIPTATYGVQSCATFYEDGTWAGTSYYSPLG